MSDDSAMLSPDDPDLRLSRCLVAGQWITAPDTIGVADPASGRTVGTVPEFGLVSYFYARGLGRVHRPAGGGVTGTRWREFVQVLTLHKK